MEVSVKKYPVRNFTKIRPVEVALIHADRQTDMTKVIISFRNCANRPKNSGVSHIWYVYLIMI